MLCSRSRLLECNLMPIYAVAENVPERERDRITPGKRYPLGPHKAGCDERGLDGVHGFAWRDDNGLLGYGLWKCCAYLNGGNWTRIDEPDEAPAPDPRDALMAELVMALRVSRAVISGAQNEFGEHVAWTGALADIAAALAKYEGANK
jgi:hypothetical protein